MLSWRVSVCWRIGLPVLYGVSRKECPEQIGSRKQWHGLWLMACRYTNYSKTTCLCHGAGLYGCTVVSSTLSSQLSRSISH